MALVSGTGTRYDFNGLRESLHDRIYNISPEETPFIMGAGRGRRMADGHPRGCGRHERPA